MPPIATEDQLHTLRHMLGINTPYARRPAPYRNYAAVNPGDPEFAELERMGLVERYRESGPGFSYDWYRTTPRGYNLAMASRKSIREPLGTRRYAKFLDLRESFPDMTFREFLTNPDFAEARERA
ncbi:MAG: hypothetical protein HY749_15965 [Gammaproteobacteria bacterium]|nr:hypothetical protein [Gammaproteobacteria bacterium]